MDTGTVSSCVGCVDQEWAYKNEAGSSQFAEKEEPKSWRPGKPSPDLSRQQHHASIPAKKNRTRARTVIRSYAEEVNRKAGKRSGEKFEVISFEKWASRTGCSDQLLKGYRLTEAAAHP